MAGDIFAARRGSKIRTIVYLDAFLPEDGQALWDIADDEARKGYIDGRSVRLPIVAIRPGKANTAASSWASAIVREPLAGEDYVCPVGPSDSAFLLSPKKAIEGLIVAHETDADLWGNDRSVMMAGLTCTPRQMVDSFERIAARDVADRVKWGNDPFIRTIVNSWPNSFSLEKATRLGFQRDSSVDAIIQDYMETI